MNGFRQRGAISFAFRVIPNEIPGFGDLHLPPGVARLAQEHRGLVLVTGATGSGKTTTLAAMLDEINRTRKQHIVTIEDPIEVLHPDRGCIVNQREVGLDTESFGQALRRVLRQDPDVILIGELRDAETAQTALQAAESGHLVFSTLHTLDAAETIGRMVEFFPPEKQPQVVSILAGVLRGVISQRLLPRLGGGRIPAVEVMVSNARTAELIRERRSDEIPDAIDDGEFFEMQSFSKALIQLVLAELVDREIAANAATNRHDFEIALDRAQKVERTKQNAPTETESENEEAPAPLPPPSVRTTRGCRHSASQATDMRCVSSYLQRLRHEEAGFTLIEMITVMGMFLITITALSSALIAATKSEEDMNRRFSSQINARIALDQLRREIHCASAVTPVGTSSSITITLGSRCPSAGAGTTVSWCTAGSGTRYALYRLVGGTCDTTGRKTVDYLTSGTVFSFASQSTTSLAILTVTLPVNTRPESGLPAYNLADDIVLRNSTRA